MAFVIIAIALVVHFPLALESDMLTFLVPTSANGAHWGEVFIAKPNATEALIGLAILGALVGAVLWLIGRPDRPCIAAPSAKGIASECSIFGQSSSPQLLLPGMQSWSTAACARSPAHA